MDDGLPDVTLRCVADARDLVCPFDETRRRIWTANLAFVVPVGWYRYDAYGKVDRFFLRDKIVLLMDARHRGRPYLPLTLLQQIPHL